LTRIISGLDPLNCPEADNGLYSRIIGAKEGRQYNANPHDTREYINDESGIMELDATESCGIAPPMSVRFPAEDYQRLNDLIRG